ncbi:hypothetical protein AOLI_G00244300 [Acnodon oligacanthus]
MLRGRPYASHADLLDSNTNITCPVSGRAENREERLLRARDSERLTSCSDSCWDGLNRVNDADWLLCFL